MKSIFFAVVLIAGTTCPGLAQPNTASHEQAIELSVPAENELPRITVARKRAEKNFWQTHTEVENVRWFNDAKGFFVYYTRDGNRGRRFYNPKGRFVYDAISYPEKYLSPRLRDWVKSVYYNDYRITNVIEMHGSGSTVYYVQLTDGRTWRNIRLFNGEMELVKEFKAR